jgi:hypothetical protein
MKKGGMSFRGALSSKFRAFWAGRVGWRGGEVKGSQKSKGKRQK